MLANGMAIASTVKYLGDTKETILKYYAHAEDGYMGKANDILETAVKNTKIGTFGEWHSLKLALQADFLDS